MPISMENSRAARCRNSTDICGDVLRARRRVCADCNGSARYIRRGSDTNRTRHCANDPEEPFTGRLEAYGLAAAGVRRVGGGSIGNGGPGNCWRENRQVRENQIVSELADLHVSALASATPVDVISSDRHTVKPWFEGKIPFTFNLPELQGTSFELLGGRVSYLEQSPGAELDLKTRKHQISVFIFQDRAVPAGISANADARSFHIENWKQGELRYFAIGDVGTDDLRGLRDLLENAK